MTNNGLVIEIKVAKETIKRIANPCRQAHPEWFKKYKSPAGKIHECYAPELCDLIRETVKNKRS